MENLAKKLNSAREFTDAINDMLKSKALSAVTAKEIAMTKKEKQKDD